MIFLELHIHISELPFIVVWIFLSFLSPVVKGQRKIQQHVLMLKTNFVCDNILQIIFLYLEMHILNQIQTVL